MGVLAWRWHLDRSSPVEIVVTECIGQLLQLNLLQVRLVQSDMHMGGEHTSLGGRRWSDEEVKSFVGLVFTPGIFNQASVNDAS